MIRMKSVKLVATQTLKMSDHESVHFVRKFLNCQKFIRNNTFPAHKRQCQTLNLQKLYCGLENCNFSTYHDFSLRRHRKRHEGSFKCVSCSCPKFFRTKEKLEKHSHSHSLEGYPCQHCGKCFKSSSNRTKHVKVVHLVRVI